MSESWGNPDNGVADTSGDEYTVGYATVAVASSVVRPDGSAQASAAVHRRVPVKRRIPTKERPDMGKAFVRIGGQVIELK